MVKKMKLAIMWRHNFSFEIESNIESLFLLRLETEILNRFKDIVIETYLGFIEQIRLKSSYLIEK